MNSQGAKSVISDDMQNLTQGKEDLSNQIRGHKANLSNPSASPGTAIERQSLTPADTSEESKQNSAEAIEALGGEKDMRKAAGASSK